MFFQYANRIRILIISTALLLTSILNGSNIIKSLPEGVSIFQLDNGIQVMLIEKPSLPMVGINTVVKVGSAYENFATSGMSHMLEHLLFNGTSTMTQKELYDSTDIIGGYNNANTAEYFTNFMMVTPSENIVEGMKLQAAMLFDSVIPEEKFEKEKGIVLEEIAKMLAKSNEQIERNLIPIIYEGHALSLPTVGTYSTIANMNRDDVYSFYKNYYVPNNMIISVIGNFNSSEMLNNIKEIYGKAKPSTVEYPQIVGLENGFNTFTNSNNNKIFHRFYSGENTQLQYFFEVDQPANLELFDILEIVLDENKDKIKTELNNLYGTQVQGVEFSIKDFPVKNYIQAALILTNENELEKIGKTFVELLYKVKFEIPEETIKNESVKARTRFLQNTEKPHMFGIYNADIFAEYGIEQILSLYSGDNFVNAANELKNFALNKSYITIVQHPEKSSEKVNQSGESKIKNFDGSNEKADIIVKQNTDSDLLAIHYLIKNKAQFEHKYGKDAAKIWHDAFGKRMEKPELQKISAKYGFSFTVNDNPFIPMDNIYLSPEFGYIRVEGLANDVKSAIQFLNEQMLNFIPTEEEFNSANSKSMMPSMMGHGNAAQKLFESKLEEIIYENEKYPESNEPISYNQLLEFGKEYFTPANMIISVVSPQNVDEVSSYFDSFNKKAVNLEKSLGFIKEFKPIDKAEKIELSGGGEQSYLYYGFQKNINNTDEAALTVLSLLLSDEIVFDIREKQGMAYRMSAGIDIVKDKAMFNINMGTRPENVEKLVPQFPKFFTPDFDEKITSSSVKRAVNMYLGRMMFRRLSSINQAYYLGYSKYFYDDINYDSKSLDDVKKVTVDEVKDAARKYLNIENPIEIYVK
ncbi:MAG: insulinase family protein [Ignavibacteriales bacterium]|nr:insulinase family protein [Ignavibacteriales bacterium]MCB9258905.1 insulinase family protein [Ignavibacteriales bacterium]